MRRRVLALLLTMLAFAGRAQEIIYSKSDSIAIENMLKRHAAASYSSKGDLVLAVASGLIGQKYVAGTLENGRHEPLYVSCSSLDCTTFIEIVTAMSMSIAQGDSSFSSVCSNLERVRYRSGLRNGYASRLHYMSWWIADNTAKGIVEEVTASSPHREYMLTLDFMSTHPGSYSMIGEDKEMQAAISGLEEAFRGTATQYIPKEILDRGEEELEIRDGDIIALVTSIKGLDVTHVGFACWKKGRLHLLHASSSSGKVISDPETLFSYQKGKSKQKGIRVIRIK